MKILMVQTSWLGDTVLSTPVIAGIKKVYPQAELWMMTTPAASELITRDPLLSGVLIFDKRGKDKGISGFLKIRKQIRQLKFNRVYSLHKSFRTALLLWLCGIPRRIGFADAKLAFLYHRTCRKNPEDHDVLRNLSLLSGDISLDSLDTELRLFLTAEDNVNQNVRTPLSGIDPYAVLVPGSAWETKMWPWQGYRQVAHHLLDKGYPVVALGAPSEKKICDQVASRLNVINLAGRTSISDAMYVINNASLVVCNDSLALHLASAFKVPTVVIFCSTSPAFGFGPWQNNALVVERDDLDCKPCARHGSHKCPTGTEDCTRGLAVENVIGAIDSLLHPETS
jgi:heptosyltransferase-2